MANRQPALRPFDVGVVTYLSLGNDPRYEALAEALDLSVSQVHRSVQRLGSSGLLLPQSREPDRRGVLEFLLHGVRYAFYTVLGPEVRGVPTAHSAPPLSGEIVGEGAYVWADAEGEMRGTSIVPLFAAAPGCRIRNPPLYECLALVDALRVGRARERKLAEAELRSRIEEPRPWP